MNIASSRPDPGRRSRQDRQAQIFDVAMMLFERRGYDAVSVEEVCLAGGIGRATFFRLFGGKPGLIEEANRRTARLVRQEVERTGARGADALLIMGRVISRAWLSAGAPIYAMFETVMGSPAVSVGQSTAFAAQGGSVALAALAIQYVGEGKADGAFRSDLDTEAMGLSFMSLLLVACSLWVSRDDRNPAAFPTRVSQSVSVMIAGLNNPDLGVTADEPRR